jgi:hypothetical protein
MPPAPRPHAPAPLQMSTSNNSTNFAVLAEGEVGLLFKNKRDRKVSARPAPVLSSVGASNAPPPPPPPQVINVDPNAPPGDNTTRTEIRTPDYSQCVLWDHFSRRKG